MLPWKSYDKEFYYTKDQLLIKLAYLEKELNDIKSELIHIQEMLMWNPDNKIAINMLKEHYYMLGDS